MIYERDTGLLAEWFMNLRVSEKCIRAGRYGRPLTVLVVEPPAEIAGARTAHDQLALWLRRHLRASDFAGGLGRGRFAVALPETDSRQAGPLLARIRQDLAETSGGLSSFPDDGTTYEELYAAAARRMAPDAAQPDAQAD